MPTVSLGIINTADDISAYSYLGSPTMIEPGAPANGVLQTIPFTAGFRFQAVAVPKGAIITAATLTLKKDAASSTPGTWGEFRGVAADNAPPWTTVDPIAAAKTTQSKPIVDGATQAYDVAAIVQAIINRAGWASGNALAFAGVIGSATGAMAWIDFGASAANSAKLSITYAEQGPTARPTFQAMIIG